MTNASSPIVLAAVLVAAYAGAPAPAAAQDTLRLPALHAAALAHDPRVRELDLLDQQSALRLRDLAVERLPQLSVTGEASHQSDVTSLPFAPAGAGATSQPPKDRWQAQLGAEQLLYDGGSASGRREVERARLAEAQAGVDVSQYRLKDEVNGSFFSAFLLQERSAELAALRTDLQAQLDVIRARVREGAALPGDTAAIGAELLRAEADSLEAASSRRAAIEVLERLVGDTITDADVLALPESSAGSIEVADSVRARPEFAQFARARERLARESALVAADRRPRAYAFAQAGYGRPGLNQFSDDPDAYWQAGVRVEWRPWNWGTTGRRREALELQQRITDADEAAFAESLGREVRADLSDIARLVSALDTDERIIGLREQVERQGRAQLAEGAITAADYVDLRTDVLDARVARQRHRVELAQRRIHYLTTLGLEPR